MNKVANVSLILGIAVATVALVLSMLAVINRGMGSQDSGVWVGLSGLASSFVILGMILKHAHKKAVARQGG